MNKKILVIGSFLTIVAVFVYKKMAKRENGNKIKTEKVLNIEVNRAIETLDPTMAEDLTSVMEISKVYEGLLEYHYLKRPAELVPNLAESMPEISEDGTEYIFKIKKGVYFQDDKCFQTGKGRELKAQDFVYSIKRCADPKMHAPYFAMIDGKIRGLNQWRELNAKDETKFDEKVEGLQVLDDYKLKIILVRPCPQFLYLLCLHICYAIPKEAVDYYGHDIINHPVGTGPFMIKDFNAQENKVVAIRNPNFREKYYPTDASDECKDLLIGGGKRLPFVDKIVTSVIVEDQTKWLAFLKADLDILDLQECADIGEKIKNNKPIDELVKRGVVLINRPFAHTSMYCINCADSVMNNVLLRQAMSLAYDRNRENILFNDNLYTVAQSIIPPCLAGYDKNFVNKYSQCNIEEAKKILTKAGYPGGKGLNPITLDIKQGSLDRQEAEYFQKCMDTIGIKIIINVNSGPEMINKARIKQAQIFKMKWMGDYPDAENFLTLFHNASLDGGGIYTFYGNKEFEELYKKASIAKSDEERIEIYRKMNEIIATELPILPQIHRSKLIMNYDYVLHYDYLDSKLNLLEYVDIDMDKKAKITRK